VVRFQRIHACGAPTPIDVRSANQPRTAAQERSAAMSRVVPFSATVEPPASTDTRRSVERPPAACLRVLEGSISRAPSLRALPRGLIRRIRNAPGARRWSLIRSARRRRADLAQGSRRIAPRVHRFQREQGIGWTAAATRPRIGRGRSVQEELARHGQARHRVSLSAGASDPGRGGAQGFRDAQVPCSATDELVAQVYAQS